jgi:2-phospho-L-lactate guanylyltransferase
MAHAAAPSHPPAGVLVPVKAFADSKHRLAPVLGGVDRAALAERLATRVVAAAHDLEVWVVCDDDRVATWATTVGATVIWSPAKGLNGAVTDGVATLAAAGVERVIVSHADLPLAHDLRAAAGGDPDGVTIVPDRREDGTNVIALPAARGFVFAYGPGSFRRHRAEAEARGLVVRTLHDPDLAFDLDTPADLADLSLTHPTVAAGLASHTSDPVAGGG